MVVVQSLCHLMQSRRKRKILYDGRTKEARAFYKRMAERKAKRESKLIRKFKRILLKQRQVLSEDNLDVLRKIVKDKQNQNM